MNDDRDFAMAIHHRVPGGGLKYADWEDDDERVGEATASQA